MSARDDARNKALGQVFQSSVKRKELERALETPPPSKLDAFGRDLAAEEKWNREQFQIAGIDLVRLWYTRMDPKDNPLKFKWLEKWLAEQQEAMRAAEQKRVGKHETITRWLAIIAVAVSLASCIIAAGSWLHPMH